MDSQKTKISRKISLALLAVLSVACLSLFAFNHVNADQLEDSAPTDDMQPIDDDQKSEDGNKPSTEETQADLTTLRQQVIEDQAQNPNSPQTALTLFQLGEGYRRAKDFNNAQSSYTSALAILHDQPTEVNQDIGLVSADYRLINQPSMGMPQSGLAARIYSSLGALYLSVGEYQYAERYFTSALAYWMGNEGGFDEGSDPMLLNTAHAMTNLADAYTAQGRFYDSEILYRRALALEESTYGDDSQYLLPELNKLSNIYNKEGRRAEATRLRDRMKAIGGSQSS
jgi:tetratricopeptide (TPR) repeat protein